MKKIKLILLYSIFIILISRTGSHALEKQTHYSINGVSVNLSILDSYLKANLGYKKGIQEIIHDNKEIKIWLQEGGITEDEPAYTRSRNHFHDPLKAWDQAGLDSLFTGISSALWIQDQTMKRTTDLGGDWSWKKAKEFYYAALTGNSTLLTGFNVYGFKDIVGNTKMADAERKEFLAWTFRAVGQTMHLIEDASVPSHTRNDAHVSYNYEFYVDDLRRRQNPKFDTLLTNPIFFGGVINSIASFIDTDQYIGTNPDITIGPAIGLAEYTNANFFSEDTIFRGYPHPTYSDTTYPNIDWAHPEIADAEDGKRDNRIYIRKTIGEADARLASVSYISYDCIQKGAYQYYPIVLDDNVYNDYASMLIPRAVGYSAGLLNYFFRGTIEITPPNQYVYSIIDGR